jgi:hypothetical protein
VLPRPERPDQIAMRRERSSLDELKKVPRRVEGFGSLESDA